MGDGIAFHTPNIDGNAPLICRRLALPSFLWPYFNGVFGDLAEAKNWYQFGDMPINDVAQAFADAYDKMIECTMIGQIIATVSSGGIGDWLLLCDGSEYNRGDYPLLHSVIPDHMKTADTFFVPDLIGRFPTGADASGNVGLQGGEAEHTLTAVEMPVHRHNVTTTDLFTYEPGNAPMFGVGIGNNPVYTANEGGGQPHNNVPPYTAILYVIVAKNV